MSAAAVLQSLYSGLQPTLKTLSNELSIMPSVFMSQLQFFCQTRRAQQQFKEPRGEALPSCYVRGNCGKVQYDQAIQATHKSFFLVLIRSWRSSDGINCRFCTHSAVINDAANLPNNSDWTKLFMVLPFLLPHTFPLAARAKGKTLT